MKEAPVHFRTLEQSPRNHRGGQVSYLLLGPGQFDSKNLAITWVEGAPGSEQPAHSHPDNEQAYVIVRGRGLMTVGTETQEVGQGSRPYPAGYGPRGPEYRRRPPRVRFGDVTAV